MYKRELEDGRVVQEVHPVIRLLQAGDIPQIASIFHEIGYVPNGLGLHSKDHSVRYGEQIQVDDDLVLYLTTDLS